MENQPQYTFSEADAERIDFFIFFEGKISTRLLHSLKNAFNNRASIAEILEKDDKFFLKEPGIGRNCLRELRSMIGRK